MKCDLCNIKQAHIGLLNPNGEVTIRLCCWCFVKDYNEQISRAQTQQKDGEKGRN